MSNVSRIVAVGGGATLAAALLLGVARRSSAPPTRSAALAAPKARAWNDGDIAHNGDDGTGADVILQAFHWHSHDGAGGVSWYRFLRDRIPSIRPRFNIVYLPPPSRSAADEGYLPTDWANLDSAYGTQGELKELIGAVHAASGKVLADVVVNHRAGMDKFEQVDGRRYYDFYDFARFPMGPPDFMDGSVDAVDGPGNLNNPRRMNSGAHEGSWTAGGRTYHNDDFTGCADLNHWNPATRASIKSWLSWLRDPANAGFDGFRYDMIGGYDPAFLGEYNEASIPYLSVGEKPVGADGAQHLADIVDRSGGKTMVFDFALREKLVDALRDPDRLAGHVLANRRDDHLENTGLMGLWPQVVVTLVNNHDMQPGHTSVNPPFPWGKNDAGISTQAAYAFILTHPGIPAVFIHDWLDRGPALGKAIDDLTSIRLTNNVKRWSRVWIDRAEEGLYAAYIGDADAEQVALKIGVSRSGSYESWTPDSKLSLTQTYANGEPGGHAYCVYYRNAI